MPRLFGSALLFSTLEYWSPLEVGVLHRGIGEPNSFQDFNLSCQDVPSINTGIIYSAKYCRIVYSFQILQPGSYIIVKY